MADKSAWLHLPTLGGYAGPDHLTRCYKLDPPKVFDGVEREYVTVTVTVPQPHKDGEVSVFPATETGGLAERSVKRRAGSFVLEESPNSPDYIEGCFIWALATAGYQIVEAPTPPEPEPIEEFEPFDPSQHIVSDVWAYLDTASPTERTRVIEAERNGKARKSILAKGE